MENIRKYSFFWANFLLSSSCDNFAQEFKAKIVILLWILFKKRKKCQNCQNYCILELGGQPIRRRRVPGGTSFWMLIGWERVLTTCDSNDVQVETGHVTQDSPFWHTSSASVVGQKYQISKRYIKWRRWSQVALLLLYSYSRFDLQKLEFLPIFGQNFEILWNFWENYGGLE